MRGLFGIGIGVYTGLKSASAQISEAAKDIAARTASSAQAAEAKRELEFVRQKADRLELLCAAMWSLLREKVGLTEDQLVDRVQQLDLSDGVLDGRIAPQGVQTCPQCNRKMSNRHRRCLYCGAECQDGGPLNLSTHE